MKRPARILVASGNPGKLDEFKDLLRGIGVTLVAPAEVGWTQDVPEEGETLLENARGKAQAGAQASGLAAAADDTGLFVDALGGLPGVRSARYAGERARAAENCAKLLDALAGVPPEDRGATFRCDIVLADPQGSWHRFTGSCRGRITEEPRGAAGFGYDPLFEIPSLGRTFAEMSPEEKHRWSHRGQAIAGLRVFLEALSEEGGA